MYTGFDWIIFIMVNTHQSREQHEMPCERVALPDESETQPTLALLESGMMLPEDVTTADEAPDTENYVTPDKGVA